MAHIRWVKLGKRAKQTNPKSSLRLDDRRIAEREGIDQPGPGLEASRVTASDPATANGPLNGPVGTRREDFQMGLWACGLA